MGRRICGTSAHANARVDAAIVGAAAGTSNEPFWIQAQTNLIRWIRTAHRLAGKAEPGLKAVAAVAEHADRLTALASAAGEAATRAEDVTETEDLERWLEKWLELNPKLRQTLTRALKAAATQKLTVTSRDGRRRAEVGTRTGSWDDWDPSSLPPNACLATQNALADPNGGELATPKATDGDGTAGEDDPPRVEPLRPDNQIPDRGYKVMIRSIEMIEHAARTAEAGGASLKIDLEHRNRREKRPDSLEIAFRKRTQDAVEQLKRSATAIHSNLVDLAQASRRSDPGS